MLARLVRGDALAVIYSSLCKIQGWSAKPVVQSNLHGVGLSDLSDPDLCCRSTNQLRFATPGMPPLDPRMSAFSPLERRGAQEFRTNTKTFAVQSLQTLLARCGPMIMVDRTISWTMTDTFCAQAQFFVAMHAVIYWTDKQWPSHHCTIAPPSHSDPFSA